LFGVQENVDFVIRVDCMTRTEDVVVLTYARIPASA